jgi:hypothetical protein
MPLIRERQARNITPLCNSITDMPSERWYVVWEQHGNTCEELAGMAHISTAF